MIDSTASVKSTYQIYNAKVAHSLASGSPYIPAIIFSGSLELFSLRNIFNPQMKLYVLYFPDHLHFNKYGKILYNFRLFLELDYDKYMYKNK